MAVLVDDRREIRPTQVHSSRGRVEVERVRAALVQGPLHVALLTRRRPGVEPGGVVRASDTGQLECKAAVGAAVKSSEAEIEHADLIRDRLRGDVADRAIANHMEVDRHGRLEPLARLSLCRGGQILDDLAQRGLTRVAATAQNCGRQPAVTGEQLRPPRCERIAIREQLLHARRGRSPSRGRRSDHDDCEQSKRERKDAQDLRPSHSLPPCVLTPNAAGR